MVGKKSRTTIMIAKVKVACSRTWIIARGMLRDGEEGKMSWWGCMRHVTMEGVDEREDSRHDCAGKGISLWWARADCQRKNHVWTHPN